MTKDEALKMALEALEEAWYHVGTFQPTEKAIDLYDEARTAIKEALAQPEQEPVVESFIVHMYNFGYKAGHHDTVEGQYIDLDRRNMGTYHSDIVAEWVEDVGYHTTPPQRTWVGLTEDEVNDLYMEGMGIHATIEATEAKLEEKNT